MVIFKPEFGPNGNMIYIDSIWSQDFRISNAQDRCRGVCYDESHKSYVYLDQHETVAELIDTCVHESIHMAIGTFDADDDFNIEEEHETIRRLLMANYIL